MSKKLEELFNLPGEEQEEVTSEPHYEVTDLTTAQDDFDTLEKINDALPRVKGLEASDAEMDELADLAKESFKELMDLGMNVEARFANEIFTSAGTFLGHAITAKTAKMNKKLKMIDLQLKKARLDQTAGDGPDTGTGKVLDRNELLERLKQNKKDSN